MFIHHCSVALSLFVVVFLKRARVQALLCRRVERVAEAVAEVVAGEAEAVGAGAEEEEEEEWVQQGIEGRQAGN